MLNRVSDLQGKTPTLLSGALLLGGIVVALVGSAAESLPVIALGLVASLVGEFPLRSSAPELNKLLRNASIGYTTRLLVRAALALAFALQSADRAWAPLALCALVVVIRGSDVVLSSVLRTRSSILIRNIEVPSARKYREAPALLIGSEVFRALPIEILVLTGLVVSGPAPLTGLLIALAGIIFGLALVLASAALIATGAVPRRGSMNTIVQSAIDACAPTVVLHFSGGVEAVYQLNMWLATLERMKQPTMILLRENEVFRSMATTSLPTISVPKGPDLLTLQFPTVRVGLYVANVGNNIHFLRLPHIKSVFIGHGDSDKSASFNPYSRVYSEVWVAGPAGRERYRRADVGIRDEDVFEVGRPQAAPLAQVPATLESKTITVLYAPTWEGWNDDQNYCSVATIGLAFVEHVLRENLPIRIIYRPHPFIGVRSAAVRRAHGRIIELLASANGVRGLTVVGPDDAQAATSAVQAEEALLDRDAAFFASLPDSAHVALDANWQIGLIGSMLAADGMLTDISSVLSDFVATGKPFAVTNPTGLAAEEFIDAFPSASAGPLLGPKGAGRDVFLDMLTNPTSDPFSARRSDLKTYLLGSEPQNAQTTFNSAVDRLVHLAEARHAEPTPDVETGEAITTLAQDDDQIT